MREDYEGMELEIFEEQYITTRVELLNELEAYLSAARSKKGLTIYDKHSNEFKKVYLGMITEFYNKIKNTNLFNELEPWWSYYCEIDETGASLHLAHAEYVGIDDDGMVDALVIDDDFELVKINTKLLSVEEYAQIYEVSVGTVRQWIRRGKIRSAIKTGNEWRIPELSELQGRGYSTGRYYFKEDLCGIPEEYAFVSHSNSIRIEQGEGDMYKIYYSGDADEEDNMVMMNTKEREKFELYLISNSDINAYKERFATIEITDGVYC